MKLMLTALRVLIGSLFVGHGTQKLFGWFGGEGLDATGETFESMGLRPGRRMAAIAGASEAIGGALLATGLATPAAGAMLTGTMSQAIHTVHAPNGPWITNQGWEYNGVLIAAVLAIVEHGPGALSLDNALGIERNGLGWAMLAAAAGAAGPQLLLASS